MIIANKRTKCNRFTPTGQCFRGPPSSSNKPVKPLNGQGEEAEFLAAVKVIGDEDNGNESIPFNNAQIPHLDRHHETIGQFLAKKHHFDLKKSLMKHVKGAHINKTQEVVEHVASSHKYSRLANASYTYHSTKGKINAVHDELKNTRYNYVKDLKDFEVDKQLSSLDDVVLHNKITKETVVSYRGTAVAQDWGTNARIAFSPNAGQSSKRYTKAEEVLNKVMVKYGKQNLKVVGHSQGGGVSSHLGQKHNIESHNFNPAVSIRQIHQNHVGKYKHNHRPQHIYRTDLDGVSMNTHAPSIQKNFKVQTLDTVPNADKNPIHVHGLGDNFAPQVVEELDGDMVKVVRNTKLTSLSKGASGMAAIVGVAATAYTTGMDIKDDASTNKSTGQKVKDVGVDLAKNAGEFVGDTMAFDAAVATGGMSVVASYYANNVAEDLADTLKSFTTPKADYSKGYTCYGYDCP